MTRSAEEKWGGDLQNKWADSFRCMTTCPSDQHPAYEHWEHTKGRDSAISQVPHVGAAIYSRESPELNIKWQTWNHFTYLSPFGRLTVDLITTMWIPRNDRFVFLDKITFFRVCGSQCRGYVRAVRSTSGSLRHFLTSRRVQFSGGSEIWFLTPPFRYYIHSA